MQGIALYKPCIAKVGLMTGKNRRALTIYKTPNYRYGYIVQCMILKLVNIVLD